jgi:tRNA G10  N-methylase Trm11
MRHFLVAGSHPTLSFAEAMAVLSDPAPRALGTALFCEESVWNGDQLMDRLAGTVKLGDEVFSCPVNKPLDEQLAEWIETHPREKRVLFGLTIVNDPQKRLGKLPLQLKRALQARGRSVRWVTGDKGDLSPAAVAKLDLTRAGYDFVIAVDGDLVRVGVTTAVQQADLWSHLDFNRPRRDARNGMLPPKIAQIMVNLAEHETGTLLDPFCGGGTILGQAAHMGFSSLIASDIATKQVEDTKTNLDWMKADHLIPRDLSVECFAHDATRLFEKLASESIQTIVTEGFLGAPLTGTESLRQLEENADQIAALWEKSLVSFAKIQPRGGKIVCVWPILTSLNGTVMVDLESQLASFGYKRLAPRWHKSETLDLIYARPDQYVKRRILLLERL